MSFNDLVGQCPEFLLPFLCEDPPRPEPPIPIGWREYHFQHKEHIGPRYFAHRDSSLITTFNIRQLTYQPEIREQFEEESSRVRESKIEEGSGRFEFLFFPHQEGLGSSLSMLIDHGHQTVAGETPTYWEWLRYTYDSHLRGSPLGQVSCPSTAALFKY